jgi:hypothetical protein
MWVGYLPIYITLTTMIINAVTFVLLYNLKLYIKI